MLQVDCRRLEDCKFCIVIDVVVSNMFVENKDDFGILKNNKTRF